MNRSRWFLLGKQGQGNQISVYLYSFFFANSKSTSHDFKASSVLLADACNEKFFLFLSVGLMHSACPAHSVYSTVKNIAGTENFGNKTILA